MTTEQTQDTPNRGPVDSVEQVVLPAWIVVNIGCIECGVSTNIVGVFRDKARADAVAKKLDRDDDWRERGHNVYEVFPVPSVDTVAEEYQPFLGENSALSNKRKAGGTDHQANAQISGGTPSAEADC